MVSNGFIMFETGAPFNHILYVTVYYCEHVIQ